MALKRRSLIWIVPAAIVLLPLLAVALLSWTYPLPTGTAVMAVYQHLPSSVRYQPTAWRLMNAYVRATTDKDQPREVAEALRQRKRPDYLVVALGDSATAAANVDPDERWTFQLQKMMHYRLRKTVEVVSAAVSGEIAPLGLKRLERDVLALKPDLVIVGYLINDSRVFGTGADGQGQTIVSFDEYLRAMRTIVARVRDTRRTVMVFTCHPIQSGFFGVEHLDWATIQDIVFTARVTALKGLAMQYNVPLADTFNAIAKKTDQVTLYDADNLHLNADGHQLVARLIFETWAEKIYPSLTAPPAR